MELRRGCNGPEDITAKKGSTPLEAQEQQGKKSLREGAGESQARGLSAREGRQSLGKIKRPRYPRPQRPDRRRAEKYLLVFSQKVTKMRKTCGKIKVRT